MQRQRFLLPGICLLLGATALRASGAPPVVSPGDGANLVVIESRCPTFSWGAAAGARAYELAVYRLGRDGEEAVPVLDQRIAGAALGWTPPADRCLERGRRYAWSVRAIVRAKASEWSSPGLFEVAGAPTKAEIEAAVSVLRRVLGNRSGRTEPAAGRDAPGAGAPPLPAAVPASRAVGATQLSIAGGVEAVSFSGDGSLLTSLDPASLTAGTAGIDISGTAADVTGTTTVAHGGTGAATAAGARANLGAASLVDFTAHAGNVSAHHTPPTTLPPSGAAGGDLSGTYPAPAVVDDSHVHGDGTIADSISIDNGRLFAPAGAGDVGIGTTSPNHRLDVVAAGTQARLGNNTSDAGMFLVSITPDNFNVAGGASHNGTTWVARDADAGIVNHAGSAGIGFFTDTGLSLGVAFTPTERMRITPAGNVGIGTTAPDELLSVNGNASKAGGGSWATFSDERLKTIEGSYDAGLDEVARLVPVRYRYRADNALGIPDEGEHIGLSAQAVETVIPEAVSIGASGYRLLDDEPIVFAMLNAIKELKRQNERLRSALLEIEAGQRAAPERQPRFPGPPAGGSSAPGATGRGVRR